MKRLKSMAFSRILRKIPLHGSVGVWSRARAIGWEDLEKHLAKNIFKFISQVTKWIMFFKKRLICFADFKGRIVKM